MRRVQTICDVLASRAIEAPDKLAYAFLERRGSSVTTLSYAVLAREVRAVASVLRRSTALGDRVGCIAKPGLGFVVAFYACLWSGRIAVPIAPPRGEDVDAAIRVLSDADVSAVLADAAGIEMLLATGLTLAVIDIEEARAGSSLDTDGPEICETAYLQYTSGSTGNPKGVIITHANLLANSEQIRAAFGHTEDSVGVIWLPPYHDMGLVGGVIQPLHVGFPVYLMSPSEFLRSPLTWLEAISRYRATTSGGPNFSFEQCVRRIAEDKRGGLDLSSWSVAFCGAEPVSLGTLRRFQDAFAAAGFRPAAFTPCYGLAEATLIVSCVNREAEPTAFKTADAPPEGYVDCGPPVTRADIVIVEPATLEMAPPGKRGEILVATPSLSPGYWRRPGELPLVTLARRETGPYLRTGDLGFLHGGSLHVCGRLKAMAIIRGRNISFEDVESAALAAHPRLAGLRAVAFVAGDMEQDRLVLLVEADSALRREPLDEITEAVCERISRLFGVQLHDLRFVASSDVPKTRSGKVRREACRAAYESPLVLPAQGQTI